MTESDRGAIDSALNDAEFPDDERGLTGAHDRPGGSTDPEGQTARDISYEDDGVPDVSDNCPAVANADRPCAGSAEPKLPGTTSSTNRAGEMP